MKLILLSIIFFLGIVNFTNGYTFNDSNITKKQIVQSFCSEAEEHNNTFIYSSRSVFLKILCDSTKIYDDKDGLFAIEDNILKIKDYENLIEEAEKENPGKGIAGDCVLNYGISINSSSLNNIDFNCVAKDIFNKLASDYINMLTYIAYGGDKQDIKKFEKDFFIGEVCSGSYLNSNNSDKKWCKHPETYKYVKSINTSLKSVLKNLNLFKNINNVDDIYKIFQNEDNCKDNLGCEYSLTIKNGLYNELYFYSLFLTYYSLHISKNTSSTSLKMAGDNTQDFKVNNIQYFKVNNMKEYIEAQKEITIARLSVKKSLKIVSDIYWTYPIHVGFLAIIEDFKELRNTLVKIYTPIDQLRYKLKNVQDLDKH